MTSKRIIVILSAVLLALFIGYRPAPAQVVTCDPADPLQDCDGDGIPNGQDTCDNLDSLADCDGDGVANGVDQCPATVVGGDLVIGDVTLTGFGDTILPTGCSLAESLAATIQACATGTPGTGVRKPKGGPGAPGGGTVKNHGQFVSCVAHATNALKKAKIITGQQKGAIQSAAAQADIP